MGPCAGSLSVSVPANSPLSLLAERRLTSLLNERMRRWSIGQDGRRRYRLRVSRVIVLGRFPTFLSPLPLERDQITGERGWYREIHCEFRIPSLDDKGRDFSYARSFSGAAELRRHTTRGAGETTKKRTLGTA